MDINGHDLILPQHCSNSGHIITKWLSVLWLLKEIPAWLLYADSSNILMDQVLHLLPYDKGDLKIITDTYEDDWWYNLIHAYIRVFPTGHGIYLHHSLPEHTQELLHTW